MGRGRVKWSGMLLLGRIIADADAVRGGRIGNDGGIDILFSAVG
jgi:hypothetical protein